MFHKDYLLLDEFRLLIRQYTRQELRIDGSEICKITLKASKLEGNDKLRSVFFGVFITAQLDIYQKDPSMMEALVSINALAKKITDAVINSKILMDSIESNVRWIVVAEIEKQEDNEILSEQWKELYSSKNDEKQTEKETSAREKEEIKLHS